MRQGRIIADTFLLQRQLLNESTGPIWRALDQSAGRLVRLHFPPEPFFRDRIALARLHEQFDTLRTFEHPHVVSPERIIRTEDNRVLIVSRYVDGPTLSEYASQWIEAEGEFPFHLILDVLRPIASALDKAHDRGLAHLALSPSRIVVSRAEGVQLHDFRSIDLIREQRVGADPDYDPDRLTELRYLAPEQHPDKVVYRLTGDSDASGSDRFPADRYSLGLIAGALFFGGKEGRVKDASGRAFVERFYEDPIRALPEKLPKQIADSFRRMLNPVPEGRFPSCGAFLDSLADRASATPSPEHAARAREPRIRRDVFCSFEQIRRQTLASDAGRVGRFIRRERRLRRLLTACKSLVVLVGIAFLVYWLMG